MGRRRTTDRHLPARMFLRHGAYYHVRHGKWLRLAPASDYGAALRAYADLEARPARLRLVEMLHAYIAATPLAESTAEGYRKSIKRLEEAFGNPYADEIKRPGVFQYVNDRMTVAANRDRALLSAAYSWAQNMGHVAENPAKGIGRRAPEKPRKRYLSDAELAAILAHADRRFALLCLFAWLTGARQGDVVRVTTTDCGPDGVRIGGRKTGEAVTVTYTPTLAEVIRQAAGDRTGVLFLNTRGKPWTEGAVRQAWDEARRKAGIGDARFHDLRRKAGTELDLAAAQALLGHTDSRITRRHYHHKRTARAAR